jgi:hypothetical protein
MPVVPCLESLLAPYDRAMFLCKKFLRAAPPDAGIEFLSVAFFDALIDFFTVICLMSEKILTPDCISPFYY